MKEKPIRKAPGYEPQRNLPRFNPWKGAENRFVLSFAKSYQAGFNLLPDHHKLDQMACAREIPANGYGIADLVSVTWKEPRGQTAAHARIEDFMSGGHTLRAFELKISDWRKGLQQASRYRFFTHIPIAVLHASKSRSALANLGVFQIIGVGLWTFDPPTGIIIPHYTPCAVDPRDSRHHLRTLRLLAKVTKALPVA